MSTREALLHDTEWSASAIVPNLGHYEDRHASSAPTAGHRFLAHTADVIVEAWAPTRAACIAEVLRAFGELVVGELPSEMGTPSVITSQIPVRIEGANDAELLALAVEEAIFVMDTKNVIPIRATLADADSALKGELYVAAVSDVEILGAAPKGIVVTTFGKDADLWRAKVILDV